MTYKNTIISLIMIMAIGLATWTTLLTYHPDNIAVADKGAVPDAFMEEVTAVILDKQGKPKMKIVTPKLVHYAENDTTDLTLPHLTLYRKSPQPWYITSKHAKAIEGTEKVDFWQDVTIQHSGDIKSPATVIKTPTLTVHPTAQTADTVDLITMMQPNIVVKATGMHADMNSGDIKLLSQARGEYVPSS